jgi:hypothetical protein
MIAGEADLVDIEVRRGGSSWIPSSALIVSRRVFVLDLFPSCIPLPAGAEE